MLEAVLLFTPPPVDPDTPIWSSVTLPQFTNLNPQIICVIDDEMYYLATSRVTPPTATRYRKRNLITKVDTVLTPPPAIGNQFNDVSFLYSEGYIYRYGGSGQDSSQDSVNTNFFGRYSIASDTWETIAYTGYTLPKVFSNGVGGIDRIGNDLYLSGQRGYPLSGGMMARYNLLDNTMTNITTVPTASKLARTMGSWDELLFTVTASNIFTLPPPTLTPSSTVGQAGERPLNAGTIVYGPQGSILTSTGKIYCTWRITSPTPAVLKLSIIDLNKEGNWRLVNIGPGAPTDLALNTVFEPVKGTNKLYIRQGDVLFIGTLAA